MRRRWRRCWRWAEIHGVAYNWEERRQALLKVTRLRQEDASLLLEVARIEEESGDIDQAIATLRRAQEMDASDNITQRLAQLYLENGQEDEGFALLAELSNRQGDVAASLRLVSSMCSLQAWQRAQDFVTSLTPDQQDDPRMRYLYAVALEELERPSEALAAFKALLLAEDDESWVSAQTHPQGFGGWWGHIQAMMPAGALELMQFMELKDGAYSYRVVHRQPFGVQYGGGGNHVDVPQVPEVLEAYVLAHMGRLLEESQGDDQVAHVASRLATAGIVRADQKLTLAMMPDQALAQGPAAFIEKYPDDLAVQALGLLFAAQEGGLSLEAAKAHYANYLTHHPELSVYAAFITTDADEAFLTEALNVAEGLENPSPMLVMAILQSLNEQGTVHGILNDAQQAKLHTLLLDWYQKPAGQRLQNAFGFGSYVFVQLASILVREGDADRFVGLLEYECEFGETAGWSAKQSAHVWALGLSRTRWVHATELATQKSVLSAHPCVGHAAGRW